MGQIVEIKGLKFEVDERTAELRRIESFAVGDPIKLLLKTYSGHDVKPGVVVGFEDFKSLPSIAIAYLEHGGELKIVYINEKTEHEIIPAQEHDLNLNRDIILDGMNRAIERAESAVREAKAKHKFFVEMFGKHFAKETVNV